jgi:hypothetical protein
MSEVCDRVRRLLPALVEPPEPEDPEEAEFAPLRRHLEGCGTCVAERDRYEAVLALCRTALAEESSESVRAGTPESSGSFLSARARDQRGGFLALVRERRSQPGGEAESRSAAARAAVRQGLQAATGWAAAFFPLQLPRLAPLAAADPREPEAGSAPELFQARSEGGKAFVELLRAGAESQLFLTLEEEALQESFVEVTLTLESGQSASHRLRLQNGTATWSLPAELVLEGACSVQAAAVAG